MLVLNDYYRYISEDFIVIVVSRHRRRYPPGSWDWT